MTQVAVVLLVASTCTAALAGTAAAQGVRPIVIGSVGIANVYRADDRSFGTEANVGGGGGIEWKRLGAGFDLHHTTGLTPKPVPCALVNVQCVGSARSGVLSVTVATGDVSYAFSEGRARPYVVGSIGALSSKGVTGLTQVIGGVATTTELPENDTGLAIGVGFGVDVALTPSLSLRPEFRTYTSSALSRPNLGLHRASIALRYGWPW